jgi:hypothetical protein
MHKRRKENKQKIYCGLHLKKVLTNKKYGMTRTTGRGVRGHKSGLSLQNVHKTC